MSDAVNGSPPTGPAPRPPEGDWLGTPYLRFERHLPFAHLTVDYQFVNNPAYNRDRGPVSVFGIRARLQF